MAPVFSTRRLASSVHEIKLESAIVWDERKSQTMTQLLFYESHLPFANLLLTSTVPTSQASGGFLYIGRLQWFSWKNVKWKCILDNRSGEGQPAPHYVVVPLSKGHLLLRAICEASYLTFTCIPPSISLTLILLYSFTFQMRKLLLRKLTAVMGWIVPPQIYAEVLILSTHEHDLIWK